MTYELMTAKQVLNLSLTIQGGELVELTKYVTDKIEALKSKNKNRRAAMWVKTLDAMPCVNCWDGVEPLDDQGYPDYPGYRDYHDDPDAQDDHGDQDDQDDQDVGTVTTPHVARDNIHSVAHTMTKKPNKATAQLMIEKLYKNAPSESEAYTLAALFKFFQPLPPKKPKTALEWVSLAVSKEQTRYYLTAIYRDSGTAVATNGDIMFLCPDNGDDGYIDMNRNPIALDGTFPQWRKVLPETAVEIDGALFTVGESGQVIHPTSHAMGFDKKNFDKATVYGHNPRYFWDGGDSPMLITFDDGLKAVIMPMRLGK